MRRVLDHAARHRKLLEDDSLFLMEKMDLDPVSDNHVGQRLGFLSAMDLAVRCHRQETDSRPIMGRREDHDGVGDEVYGDDRPTQLIRPAAARRVSRIGAHSVAPFDTRGCDASEGSFKHRACRNNCRERPPVKR